MFLYNSSAFLTPRWSGSTSGGIIAVLAAPKTPLLQSPIVRPNISPWGNQPIDPSPDEKYGAGEEGWLPWHVHKMARRRLNGKAAINPQASNELLQMKTPANPIDVYRCI